MQIIGNQYAEFFWTSGIDSKLFDVSFPSFLRLWDFSRHSHRSIFVWCLF